MGVLFSSSLGVLALFFSSAIYRPSPILVLSLEAWIEIETYTRGKMPTRPNELMWERQGHQAPRAFMREKGKKEG